MVFSPDTEELIDTINTELLCIPKKDRLSLCEKIVERNKKFLEKYNKKNNNCKTNNIQISKKKDSNDKLVEQNNEICKMFDSINKKGFKEPQFKKVTIFQPRINKKSKCSSSKKISVDINRKTRLTIDSKEKKNASLTIIKSNYSKNNKERSNNNDKYVNCPIPNIKYFQKVEGEKKCIKDKSSLHLISITTWNQLISAYVLLFLYLYLILEIRNALDPIIYHF